MQRRPSGREALEALSAGRPDMLSLLDRAIADNPHDLDLVIAEAEAKVAMRAANPLGRLESLLARHPDWHAGQTVLASLRWELGDRQDFLRGFTQALSRNPANAGLWNAYIAALAGAEFYAEAADAARQARRYFDLPILKIIEASHAGMAGDDRRSAELFAQVPPDAPDRAEVEVRYFFRTGDFGAAARTLDSLRAASPHSMSIWALTEICWRLTGDPRSDWLSGDPRFVRVLDLGFSADELERLAGLLRRLHVQSAQPIGQSVRSGTQTRGRLFDREDREIVALRAKIQEQLESYRQSLGPADPAHPLLRHADRPLRAEGGWSVRLTDSGFHVPHLHPAGIVSSACYIALPEPDPQGRKGWLELGRPPADLRLTLDPVASIEPKRGKLVLFPSFLYHGTRPFDRGERLSVAFDAA